MSDKDADTIRAVLAGDVRAFGELYDRYARLVRAICYDTTKDLTLAQDLSQEVFIRAHRKLPALRRPERFGAWLVSIARNVCREWRRKQLRDRHRYVGQSPTVLAPTDPISKDGTIDQLREAITLLPEKERLALHAFYLQSQSVDQARAILGLSRSGMYQILSRARKRLERLMRDYGEGLR